MRNSPHILEGSPREGSGPTTSTTGYVPGAAGAAGGACPGEGAMGEGLPHAWGVTGGVIPPGEIRLIVSGIVNDVHRGFLRARRAAVDPGVAGQELTVLDGGHVAVAVHVRFRRR